MAPVLLLGGSGRLGWAIAARRACDAPSSADLDLRNDDDLARRIDELEPELVINCAGLTDVDGCWRDPAAADELNGKAPGRLAARCARAGVMLIHISTDYVFSGHPERRLTETDEIAPVNRYGQSKARGEGLVLDSGAEALVARVQWLFGSAKNDFCHFVRRRLLAGLTVPVVRDQVGVPSLTTDLASWLLQLAEINARGVIHLANGGETSRLDQAGLIAEHLGVSPHFEAVTWAELGRPAARPDRSVLDTTVMQALLNASPQVSAPQPARPWEQAQAEVLRLLDEEEARRG